MDSKQYVNQVLVLAAGKGTRMRSNLPKVLHRVCGLTLLERVLRASLMLHPSRVVVVAGFGADLVQRELDVLRESGLFGAANLEVVQQLEQKGTGHAVLSALPALEEGGSVMILPGDCPLITGEELREFALSAKNSPLSFVTCEPESPTGYGRVIRDANGAVRAIVEQKDCTDEQKKVREINAAIYLAEFSFLKESVSQLTAVNAQGEYYLTDIIGYGVKKGLVIGTNKLKDPDAALGANSRAELSVLEAKRRAAINWAIMESGVTLEDPATTYIDEDVKIGAESFIGAGTKLKGRTVIGAGARIDGNSLILDSQLGERVHVKLSCVIAESELGSGIEVGPFAHLRPGSRLEDESRIGNFVETKKAVIGAGAKVNHLSYIGDANVGGKTNIGAGVITCNYDGVHKHQTTIGEGCFIGTNSSLVAPVSIGSGAFVGAGSVITKDVPSGALGLGRAKQANVEGWVERRRRESK